MPPVSLSSSVLPRVCWHSAIPKASLLRTPSSAFRFLSTSSSSSLHSTAPRSPLSTSPRSSTINTFTRSGFPSIVARSATPLAQISKRYCSYRRMCHARHADESFGSTNVAGREVLPSNVKPVHYDLTLEPDFEKFTYEGTVIIE